MRSFFWPQNIKIDPTPLNRLGRVVHWTFVGFAALWMVGLVIFVGEDGVDDGGAVMVCLGFGATCWVIGRAARYVLSGE